MISPIDLLYLSINKYQVNKKNVVKDFVHVAGPLGVTHLLMLSKTEMGTYLVSI